MLLDGATPTAPRLLFVRRAVVKQTGNMLSTKLISGLPSLDKDLIISRLYHGIVAYRALGILIHEMLNGEPPFGYGGDGLLQRIVGGLPRLDSINDGDGAGSDDARLFPIVRWAIARTVRSTRTGFGIFDSALR